MNDDSVTGSHMVLGRSKGLAYSKTRSELQGYPQKHGSTAHACEMIQLLVDLGDDSGADRSAALPNRELQPLLARYRREKFHC